ncbi:MAG: peptide MFS transporter [Gemmatimonadota bacterium]
MTTTTIGQPVREVEEKQFWGHPRGLSTLFFTELWERFSYYGMRALLVLFMTAAVVDGGMALNTVRATAIYGLYTAAVYLLALPGGWVADRLLGQRRAVFTGGVVIASGHFSMAIPTTVSFYLGLILIVIGTGLLKPNVSAIVGELYGPAEGERRDAGFSIFYMGINIGALVGPLVCGYLGERVNWHLGFSAAGIGMVLGLIQYKLGGRYLGSAGELRSEVQAKRAEAGRTFLLGVLGVIGLTLAVYFLGRSGILRLSVEGVADATGYVIVALAILYFMYVLMLGQLEPAEKKRVIVIFFLFVGAALFWSGFEQAGSSMNLFARDMTDRSVLGWEMPTSFLQSVNPTFIILLAPVFGALWVTLGSRAPSLPLKFGLGLALLGVGFLVIAWGASFAEDGTMVSPMWLIVTYFLHTCGELCLSPVGLSSVTKLSPKKLVGQMMGIWFMGAALGNLIAGRLAGRFETMAPSQLFFWVAVISGAAGVLFFLFSRPVKRLMGGVY